MTHESRSSSIFLMSATLSDNPIFFSFLVQSQPVSALSQSFVQVPKSVKAQLQLRGALFEYSRKLGAKVVHIVTQLHYCYDPLQLVMDLVPTKPLKPLMMVLEKVRVRILFSQLFAYIGIN